MRTTAIAVGLVAILFAALPACTDRDSKAAPAAETKLETARTSSHSFAFAAAGASAQSRVDRRVLADGSEALHGVTSVALAGEAHPLVLVETAEIDGSGRLALATAELRSGPQARDLVRTVKLDAARGAVTVRDARGERKALVQTDQPWIYEDLFTDVAAHVPGATPVSAWVVRRAAQTGARLRAVDVLQRTSYLTLSEQVVLEDGATSFVIVGDEAAITDSDFVQALPWKGLEAAAHQGRADMACSPGPA